MGNASLPLFDEPVGEQEWPAARRQSESDRHLRAARQLARRMARMPDASPEQMRAGQLICRHLLAMLEQAETARNLTTH